MNPNLYNNLIRFRKQELRIWLLRNGITLKTLADTLGISSPSLDQHLNNLTMPVSHHKKLVQRYNIPLTLLPEPADLTPGKTTHGFKKKFC